MQAFAELFQALDQNTGTLAKLKALKIYFAEAPDADAAWAVYFLTGQRLKRLIGPRQLRTWLCEATGLPEWLVEESYAHVGDLAETVALLNDAQRSDRADAERLQQQLDLSLCQWVEEGLLALSDQSVERQRQQVMQWWQSLPLAQSFLVTKLLTGSFRVGVSKKLVARALAEIYQVTTPVILHRLAGTWTPSAANFRALADPDQGEVDHAKPYPFYLAHPLEGDPQQLGLSDEWLVEWKWDGIRGQLVHRANQVFLWSRGEELVTEQFPEIAAAAARLPVGTVLDGEILVWRDGPAPFNDLQKRLNRKKVGPSLLRDCPVIFLAYDCLEWNGADLREQPLTARRAQLEAALPHDDPVLRLSPTVEGNWQVLASLQQEARARGVEGLFLKRLSSPYQAGRVKGDWWKWKVDPFTLDAVLLYAQAGHGRRSNLYTDYTFAVWDDEQLVPVAKAYSGLTDKEIQQLDRWIRRNTIERFGPVRSVKPEQVFELAFEGIAASSRHKSGVAVRFPRILRWRSDLGVKDADSLQQLRDLIPSDSVTS